MHNQSPGTVVVVEKTKKINLTFSLCSKQAPIEYEWNLKSSTNVVLNFLV